MPDNHPQLNSWYLAKEKSLVEEHSADAPEKGMGER